MINPKKSPLRRSVSAALSAALLLSSWGPAVTLSFAQQVAGKSSVISVIPQLGLLPVIPGAQLGSPSVLSLTPSALSLAPSINLAAPSLNAALQIAAPTAAKPAVAQVTPAASKPLLPSVSVPSALEAVKPSAPGESYGRAASDDFSRRITGETLAAGSGEVSDPVAVESALSPSSLSSSLSAPTRIERENGAPVIPEAKAPTRPEGEKRGAFFPLVLAGASSLIWGAFELARWGGHAFTAAQSAPTTGGAFLGYAAAAAMIVTGAFVLNAVVDASIFLAAVWRGRHVRDADLRNFLRAEVLEGRLDGNAAALVKAYRPDNKYKDFTFAFASRGLIWVRPELAATPWLLRQVLLHELTHMKASAPRGPYGGLVARMSKCLGPSWVVKSMPANAPG